MMQGECLLLESVSSVCALSWMIGKLGWACGRLVLVLTFFEVTMFWFESFAAI